MIDKGALIAILLSIVLCILWYGVPYIVPYIVICLISCDAVYLHYSFSAGKCVGPFQ